MTALELIIEAAKRGLTLQPDGTMLDVSADTTNILERERPFIEKLRQNKPAVLSLLAGLLTEDCKPWLWTAVQVLAGEFDGADKSTRESIIIGLRSIPHAICRQASARLTDKRMAGTG